MNASGGAITNEREVYDGISGRVSLGFYAYNYQGKRGIKATFFAVQKLGDANTYTRADALKDFGCASPENGTSPSIFPG